VDSRKSLDSDVKTGDLSVSTQKVIIRVFFMRKPWDFREAKQQTSLMEAEKYE
jgi:hypothetical protein